MPIRSGQLQLESPEKEDIGGNLTRKARELNALSASRSKLSDLGKQTVNFTKQARTNMNKPILIQSFTSFFSCGLILYAIAAGAQNEPEYAPEPKGRDCISQSSIRDYKVLDESNLIVSASAKRKYHVALSRRAHGLRSTWGIGFKSPTGRVCSSFSEVIFEDGFRTEKIRITSVRELNEDELEYLLVAYGKKDPEFEQAPATEEVEGAEVEELD